MPLASDADTLIVVDAPLQDETVEPLDGAAIDTVGAVVSVQDEPPNVTHIGAESVLAGEPPDARLLQGDCSAAS